MLKNVCQLVYPTQSLNVEFFQFPIISIPGVFPVNSKMAILGYTNFKTWNNRIFSRSQYTQFGFRFKKTIQHQHNILFPSLRLTNLKSTIIAKFNKGKDIRQATPPHRVDLSHIRSCAHSSQANTTNKPHIPSPLHPRFISPMLNYLFPVSKGGTCT